MLVLLVILLTLPLIFMPENKALAQSGTLPGANGQYFVYSLRNPNTSLAGGWGIQTWYGGLADPANHNPVFTAPDSIRWTPTAPWDEIDFFSANPIDLSKYPYLTLYLQSGANGMRFNIVPLSTKGFKDPVLNARVDLLMLGGDPMPGAWKVYNIPTSTFTSKGSPALIYGIGIGDANGGTQASTPSLFIDEIIFSASPAAEAGVSSGSGQTNLPSAPPVIPASYFPSISPWVFIVPGIIIFMAVFF